MATPAFMSKKVPASAAPHIREAVFADYPQISSLESRYGLNPRTFEEWSHLWTGNPVLRGRPNWKIGWVIETGDAEIVGHIANVPTACEFQGRRLLAASGRGLVVDERYRSYAFPLFSQFFNHNEADLILNTTVNSHGLHLHELFHCERVPTGAWNEAVFWITDYGNFAAKLAATKSLPLPNLWSVPLSALLSVKDAFHTKPTQALPSGYELNVLNHFDDSFDGFWEQLRQRQNGSLLSVRSSETLNWHFEFPLKQKSAWIVTITNKSQLVAYAIFLRQDNHETALKRMRLVDFQTLEDGAELLVPMLSVALQKSLAQGLHMLEAIGFSGETRRVLSQTAPHRRELPCWLYFYRAKDKHLARSLQDPAVWNPSPFDGDGSL